MADDENPSAPVQSPAPSRRPSQPKPPPRRYGFACYNCRRRKAKCDGALPACRKCVIAHETCNYDKKPSVAFAVTLQYQLEAYQVRFEQLKRAKDEDRDALLAEPIPVEKPRGGKARAPDPSHSTWQASEGASEAPNPTATSSDSELNGVCEEMSIGADGEVGFYGKTSLYHVDSPGSRQRDGQSAESTSLMRTVHDMTSKRSSEDEMRLFLSEIDPALLDELLEVYWCWPHHLHCVLCKKLFLRDLWTSGPYVSPFLLAAVLTQAARWSPRADAKDVGDHFARRTLHLLVNDIDRGSSIPTAQGLLIFSARECACGRTSQGWLYSGMAFRMARDLGMHLAPRKLGQLSLQFSEEDLALRQQLFWSCYTWDKTMSLCLGRPPIISDTIELPTADTLPDGEDADHEIWKPINIQGAYSESFVQHRALSSTRFAAYCELCIIIHDILDKLYSRPHPTQKDHALAYLNQTLGKLNDWSSKLPAELFIREASRAVCCPPLHILLLNLLYHTTVILLCRPYRVVSTTARKRCTEAAQMTDTLFTLHVRRFGFRCITWLQTYTMFVACTINVWDLKESQSQEKPDGDVSLAQEASSRLDFGLEVLRQTSSTPSAGRCASILVQLLDNVTGRNKGSQQANYPDARTTTTGDDRDSRPSRLDSHSQSLTLTVDQRQLPSVEPGPNGNDSAQPMHVENASIIGSSEHNLPIFPQTLDSGHVQCNEHSMGNHLSVHENLARGGIETPFRWLPENVFDDGSWMLTDIDIDSWSILNIPS